MSYNSTTIISDAPGNPIPQQYNPFINQYEPLQGHSSSMSVQRGRWFIVGSGATSSSIPLVTQSGASLWLSASVQNSLIGSICRVYINNTVCDALVTSVSSSGIVTVDSPFPTTPPQGSSVFLIPPEIVSGVSSFQRLIATVSYSQITSLSPVYFSFLHVLNRNARSRTFSFVNTLNQSISVNSIYLTDSIYNSSGGYNYGDVVGSLTTIPYVSGSVASAVYTSEVHPELSAHVDSIQVSIQVVGSTPNLPTSGNLQIYVSEIF